MSTAFQLLDTPLPAGVTLLEASAGTGKTYALAALVLRLVGEEDVPIGQILVTTYTIPATAELRTRIRARLTETVAAFDGTPPETRFVAEFVARHADAPEVRRRLAAAIRDFDQAVISTIHGFCQRMLLECAFETNSVPDAELIPDQSALVREVAEDYWRRTFDTHERAPFVALAGITPATLAALFSSTSAHATAALRLPALEFPAAVARLASLLATLRREWPAWRDAVHRNYVGADWAIGEWKKRDFIEPLFVLIEILATNELAPVAAYRAVNSFRPTVIAKKRGIGSRGGQMRTIPDHAFVRWTEEFAAAVEDFGAVTRAHFLDHARAALAARKDELGLLSFDDLLTRFHAALKKNDGLRNTARAKFRAALVDEFQDTDPIQSEIFNRIFGADPHRLFLIGDPKQAIFGFRGADLHAYLKARKAASCRYRLDTNHRSDAPLVGAINTLFARGPHPFVDDIPFEPVRAERPEELRPLTFEGNARAPMRFWFWDSEDVITAGNAGRTLPDIVASEIVRLLADAKLDGRSLLPRDCAVLCAINSQCREVQAALATRGVPAVVLNNASVLDSDDARELRIVLAALVQSSNEPAIRAALATSLFAFDAARFAVLAEDVAAWEAIVASFHDLHVQWRERGFIQMFRALLHGQRVRERLLAQRDGERRLTNLLHLAELLHATAREFQLAPAGLLRWFAEELQDPGPGDERELRLERDDDAVKILTIHKSKGLEWPVVFVLYLWRKAGLHDGEHPIFHDDDGVAILDLGSPNLEAAQERAEHERLAEQIRLLYVALTRAKHECHVVWGRFKDCENSALMWLLERPPAPEPTAPAALVAHAGSHTSLMLRRTLQQIAGEHPERFSVSTLPPVESRRHAPSSAAPSPGDARVFRGKIDTSWRVSSFSTLSAAPESEGHDYDYDVRSAAGIEFLGIHAFPRGTVSGVCIHEIFEKLDFTQDPVATPIVRDSLMLHGLYSAVHLDSLNAAIKRVLDAPLLDGRSLRLSGIPRERTLRELEFHLPTGMLTAQEVSAFTIERVAFEPRRGVLKGFIDLIFEHQGRFHLLDWKSNWLGPTSAHYDAAAMRAEIARHRYDLQWQLYLAALHRFLRTRLADYEPARHLGEVFYVFVRGVDPLQPALGIHRETPDLEALERLDQLFRGA